MIPYGHCNLADLEVDEEKIQYCVDSSQKQPQKNIEHTNRRAREFLSQNN